MSTQEINRYISVATKWEEKYSQAKISVDIMQSTLESYKKYFETLESQLKIQDNVILCKDAEIEKLQSTLGKNKLVTGLCFAVMFCCLIIEIFFI